MLSSCTSSIHINMHAHSYTTLYLHACAKQSESRRVHTSHAVEPRAVANPNRAPNRAVPHFWHSTAASCDAHALNWCGTSSARLRHAFACVCVRSAHAWQPCLVHTGLDEYMVCMCMDYNDRRRRHACAFASETSFELGVYVQ